MSAGKCVLLYIADVYIALIIMVAATTIFTFLHSLKCLQKTSARANCYSRRKKKCTCKLDLYIHGAIFNCHLVLAKLPQLLWKPD
jgi:hypothetical protein